MIGVWKQGSARGATPPRMKIGRIGDLVDVCVCRCWSTSDAVVPLDGMSAIRRWEYEA